MNKKIVFGVILTVMLSMIGISSAQELTQWHTVKFHNKVWISKGTGELQGYFNGIAFVKGDIKASVNGVYHKIFTYKGFDIYRVRGIVKAEGTGIVALAGSGVIKYRGTGNTWLWTYRQFIEYLWNHR